MEFRKLEIRYSLGENVSNKNAPKELVAYCDKLKGVPPDSELFLADPDLDLRTLHSNAGFRDAFVRYVTAEGRGASEAAGAPFDTLVVRWETGKQHEISQNGQVWTDVDGTALKYEVEYTPPKGAKQTVYVGIQFGAKA